jgi:hypothetical protein
MTTRRCPRCSGDTMHMHSHVIRRCPKCSGGYTPDAWRALYHLKTESYEADEHGPASKLEWRKCRCGNSLSIDLLDPENAAFAATKKEVP